MAGCNENLNMIKMASNFTFLDNATKTTLDQIFDSISRKLAGLIKYLKAKPTK
jgi:hypothetical protein